MNIHSHKTGRNGAQRRTTLACGFTLVEVLGAVALVGIVVAAAVTALAYVMRSDRLISIQTEMDMDARRLVEQLRRDLWLTSREDILLAQDDTGRYVGISFPIVRGSETINEAGEIPWSATVIYHQWFDAPNQVRRTVFEPRVELTEAERRQQLEDVIRDGDGDNTFNAAHSTTRALIDNLVHWEINANASRIDFFHPSSIRTRKSIGSGAIRSGANEITFRVVGKNPGNSGSARHLGIDVLTLTPSGLRREGEWMLPPVGFEGSAPTFQNLDGTWSGGARLWYTSAANDHEFTLAFYNDEWIERNFFGTTVKQENLHRILDDGSPTTFELQLAGNTNIWHAAEQTGDGRFQFAYVPVPTSKRLRIFLRGDDPHEGFDGGWISSDGSNVWITFSAAAGADVRLSNMAIAPSMIDPPEDAVHDDWVEIKFGGTSEFDFSPLIPPFGSLVHSVVSDPAQFVVERTNSYLIEFDLDIVPHQLVQSGFESSEGWARVPAGIWDYFTETYTNQYGWWRGVQSSSTTGVGRAGSSGMKLEPNGRLRLPEPASALGQVSVWARTDTPGSTNRLALLNVDTNVASLVAYEIGTDWERYSWAYSPMGSARPVLQWEGSSTLFLDDVVMLAPDVRTWRGDFDSTNSFVGSTGGVWEGRESVQGVERVRVGHAALGTYTSQIIDTQLDDPVYETFSWNAIVPDGSSVQLKVRAGAEPDLSDASDWSVISPATSGQTPVLAGRYAQVLAQLRPGALQSGETVTPQLRDFRLRWEGEPQFTDLSGVFSMGPNHGIYEILLNGEELLKGVTFDVEVYREFRLGRRTWTNEAKVFMEIVPRNTR